MILRVVHEPGGKTVSAAGRGALRHAATRAEAMSLVIG